MLELIILAVCLMNTVILVALANTMVKLLLVDNKKRKVQQSNLLDLPLKYDRQMDYSNLIEMQHLPDDIKLTRDD